MTSWTSPRTWVASEVVGATTMNTHVRDNLNHLAEQISRAGWTSFTPSWTNLTVGNGTNTGFYGMAGKSTIARVEFTFGSTSSVASTYIRFALPSQAITTLNAYFPLGYAAYIDASGNRVMGQVIFADSYNGQLEYSAVSGSTVIQTDVSPTAPFTWTTGDKILCTLVYERV